MQITIKYEWKYLQKRISPFTSFFALIDHLIIADKNTKTTNIPYNVILVNNDKQSFVGYKEDLQSCAKISI